MILYLHGFRSSPHSFKAQVLARRLSDLGRATEWICPQLPASPREACILARQLTAGCDPADLTVIGSSLGGFYATWLAEQTGCRAVLLNPAVTPLHDLKKYIGSTTLFHSDEPFEFKAGYIDELEQLAIDRITHPSRYLLLAATGDEVLDWRQMVEHYPGAHQHVIAGSDHGISEFPEYLDEVLAFCDRAAGPQ